MRRRFAEFLKSVACGNLILVLLLLLSADTWRGQGVILSEIQREEIVPLSSTYTDVDGDPHTVSSPVQVTPEENVRVHKLYLAAAYCLFQPANPPSWWSPQDCR